MSNNNNMDDFLDIDLNAPDDFGDDLFGGGTQSQDSFGGQTSGADLMGGGGQADDSAFFDDDGSADDDISDDQRSALSKKYIIIVVCGLAFTLAVLFIGSRVLGKKKDNSNEMLNTINNQQQVTNENTNVNVDNIMNNGNSQPVQAPVQNQDVNVNYHKDENNFSWMEITDSENVVFESEYAERIFTVTTVNHYARTVDSANNLVIKTTLSGSISGLPGTYTIEVPYSKGILLKTGNSFTVNVQLGTYNDKIVVGDITY